MNLKVSKAVFHAAVLTAGGDPETCFSMDSEKKHRRVQMELHEQSGYLLCMQEDPRSKELVRWAVPSANIISITFANEVPESPPKGNSGKEKSNKKN